MSLGAILGAALTTPASRAWGIWIDGNDYASTPGTNGHRIGVPVDSVELDLEGPGGVSAARFSIDDPDRILTLSEGQRVQFVDFTRNVIRFAGWIQSWSVRPLGISRVHDVQAQGYEAVLDWAFIPGTVVVPALTNTNAACMQMISAAVFPPGAQVRAYTPVGDPDNGDATTPIGSLFVFGYKTTQDVTVSDTSLRDALKAVTQVSGIPNGGDPEAYTITNLPITVDFQGGIRLYWDRPNDWATLTAHSGFGSTTVPADPQYLRDAGGAFHAVYVVGGNAAGTGLVSDGSGITGPIGRLNDSSITTAAGKRAAALAFMAARSGLGRAPLELESFNPSAGHVPGTKLSLRDAQLGIEPATTFVLGAATITFEAGGTRENWKITAGGLRPSAATYIRRLTRSVKIA